MSAQFFALAFTAALYPKLLALDLLLIDNRRPRLMFAAVLVGGLAMAMAIGIVAVLQVQPDAVTREGKASAGVDLAAGLILVALGGLLVTGRMPVRHRAAPAPGAQAATRTHRIDTWARRTLSEPRPALAFAIGAFCGLPGASYIAALHLLVTGTYPAATRVIAVVVFSVIEFLLIIIPLVLLEVRPQSTAVILRRSQAWLGSHAKLLMAWIALLLGCYLLISALLRLL